MLWNILMVIAIAMIAVGILFRPYLKFKRAKILFSVVLLVLLGCMLEQYIIPYYLALTFETRVRRENALVNLIANDSPYLFQNFLQEERESILKREDYAVVRDRIAVFVNTAFSKYLPFAPNDSIYHFYVTEVALDKQLIVIDPKLVLLMEFRDKFGAVSLDALHEVKDQKLINQLSAAKEALIRAAILSPQPPLTEDERKQASFLIGKLSSELADKYGMEKLQLLLDHPDRASLNKAEGAEIIIMLYEKILGMGEGNAGLIFRAMFGGR